MYAVKITQSTFLLLEAYFGLKETDQEYYSCDNHNKVIENKEFLRLIKAFQWMPVEHIWNFKEEKDNSLVTASFKVAHPIHQSEMKIQLGDVLIINDDFDVFRYNKNTFENNFEIQFA